MTGKAPGTMIQDDTVTAAQIAPGAVGSSEIANNSILAEDLAPSARISTFTSTQQTITANGTLLLAHGLGAVPRSVTASIVCQTAELGYSVGQEVVTSASVGNAVDTGLQMLIDATNVGVKFGAAAGSIRILNFSTGAIASITNANWRLIVRALA